MLPGLTERGREPFVLGDGLGELTLRLEQALLEGAHPLGRVLEAAPEDDDLFLERLQLVLEIADLALVLGEASLVLGSHDDPPLSSLMPRPGWASDGRIEPTPGTLLIGDSPDGLFPRDHLINCSAPEPRLTSTQNPRHSSPVRGATISTGEPRSINSTPRNTDEEVRNP